MGQTESILLAKESPWLQPGEDVNVPFLCVVKPEWNGWGAWSIVLVAWVVFICAVLQERRQERRQGIRSLQDLEFEILASGAGRFLRGEHIPTRNGNVLLVKLCPVLGDPRCKFSARSSVIRCAVNPSGPCDGCKDREEVVAIDSSAENLSKDS